MKHKWLAAGVLIIIEAVLCAGIIYISWASVVLAQAAGINLHVFRVDRISSEALEQKSFAITGPAALNVLNTNGSVSIVAAPAQEILVQAHKTAWGATRAEADAALAKLNVVLSQQGDALDVQVTGDSDLTLLGPGNAPTVAFTITVPVQTVVTVTNRVGKLSLAGTTGAAQLKSAFGAIDVSAITGTLAAETGNGSLSVRSVQGASMSLSSSFGNIELSDSHTGKLSINGRNGKLMARRVQAAEVEGTNEFGGVDFEEGSADQLSITSRNGDVRLSGLSVRGPLSVHSDFGTITLLKTAATAYDLGSQNGAVRVDGASGPLKARSDFGLIDISSADRAVLDLATRNGAITFSGSLAQSSQRIKTDFGAVRLSIPRDSALNLDLQTEFGRITSDFAVAVSGAATARKLLGPINGGGASLAISAQNGSITLAALN